MSEIFYLNLIWQKVWL